jgi:hypothetical protein
VGRARQVLPCEFHLCKGTVLNLLLWTRGDFINLKSGRDAFYIAKTNEMSTSFLVSTMYPQERTEKSDISHSLPPERDRHGIVCARYWFIMLHMIQACTWNHRTFFGWIHVFLSGQSMFYSRSGLILTRQATKHKQLIGHVERIIFLFPTPSVSIYKMF